MRKSVKLGMGFAAALTAAGPAMAADHQDGTISPSTAALGDPSSDITDVYAWMTSDASTVNLIMNVYPNAATTSLFSTTTKYVFHTASQAGLLSTNGVKRDIICTFSGTTAPQTTSCWLTDGGVNVAEYATGNASSSSAPLTASDTKMKIFAGVRNDPFFFNLIGFRNATSAVANAIAAYTANNKAYITGFDANKCPTLASGVPATLVGYLTHDCTTMGTAVDTFRTPDVAGTAANALCAAQTAPPGLVTTTQTSDEPFSGNVLSLVVQVDKEFLTSGGSQLSVWGATTK